MKRLLLFLVFLSVIMTAVAQQYNLSIYEKNRCSKKINSGYFLRYLNHDFKYVKDSTKASYVFYQYYDNSKEIINRMTKVFKSRKNHYVYYPDSTFQMINGAHLLSGVIYDSISVVNMILKFKNGYPCQWIIKDSRTCHILFYFDFSSQFENQPGSFFVKCNQSGRGYYESHSYYCKSKGKWKYKNVSDTLTKKLEIVFYRTDKGEKDLGITQESGYNLNIEDEFVLELRPRSYIVYRTNNPYVLVTPIVENKIKLASKTLFPVNDSKIYIKCTPSSMGLNCQQVQKDVAEKEIIDLRKLE